MRLYGRLGFLRSKRLHRYYLNGNTAFRYLLYVKESAVTANMGYQGDYDAGPTDQIQTTLEAPPVGSDFLRKATASTDNT